MISARRQQSSFADGFIAEQVGDLWDPWMRHADEVLNDDQLLQTIQQELSKRIKKSKTRGRPGTTAEVVLRMLLLKHMRDWSFETTTREVRANLVYREFTGIGGGRVPDDKTMGRLARQLGPEAIAQLQQQTAPGPTSRRPQRSAHATAARRTSFSRRCSAQPSTLTVTFRHVVCSRMDSAWSQSRCRGARLRTLPTPNSAYALTSRR